MTDQPLTPEREQEIRQWAYDDETSMVAAEQRELFAEIDRLRADLATAREALVGVTDHGDRAAVLIAREALDRIGEE